MTCWLHILGLMALAYGVGATPFGYLVARARGIDIRRHGSGNIGATNVIRVLGRKIGLAVFALDALKGLLPVLGAAGWTAHRPVFAGHESMIQVAEVLTGLAAVVGHTATFWLGFKGGKGVATSAGVMLGLAPWALLAAFVVWLAAMTFWRYVSLASILAGWTLPVAVVVQGLFKDPPDPLASGVSWSAHALPVTVIHPPNWPLLALALLIAVLVTWRHRANLQRLATGTEPKAGQEYDPLS